MTAQPFFSRVVEDFEVLPQGDQVVVVGLVEPRRQGGTVAVAVFWPAADLERREDQFLVVVGHRAHRISDLLDQVDALPLVHMLSSVLAFGRSLRTLTPLPGEAGGA